MKGEKEEFIEELDFIDDYSNDKNNEEIIEILDEEPSNNSSNNNSSNSYAKPNQNKNAQQNNNINNSKPNSNLNNNNTNRNDNKKVNNNNTGTSLVPKDVPSNGYSSNKAGKNMMNNMNVVQKTVPSTPKSVGSNGVPQGLNNNKMNIQKSQSKSSDSKEGNNKTSSSEESKKSGESTKDKIGNKVNETKNDALQAAKGAANLAAGNKVKGAMELAPVLLKQLKKKIILCVSAFFIIFFAIAAIFFAIMSPIQESLAKLQEFWDGVTEFTEKTNNMYSGLGFKTTEEAFYEELDNIYNNNFEDINLALIMSALYYTENDNDYETDYSQSPDTGNSFLSDAANSGDISSDDEYTQGKILRARMLAKGMTEECDGERVTIQEFIRLYTEQMKKDKANAGEPILGALLTYSNPVTALWDKLKDKYNAIEGPTYTTASGEVVEAFSKILQTGTLGLKTVSSVEFEWTEDSGKLNIPPKIYVTMRVKAYNEDKFKQFLATTYIPNMPEFKPYINNLTGISRDQEIERIVKDIYERESWYSDVYGKVEGNVENNDSTCVGAIENDLLTELAKPVKVGDSVSFDGEYAYGVSNGTLHNGVDLNSETSGTKEGDDVFAVAKGKVIEVDMSVSCNTSDDSSCSENGSYVALSHDVLIGGSSYTFVTLYANLKSGSNSLKVGDKVKKGDKIGKVGKTGNAKIPQLHFAFLKGQTLSDGSSIDPSNLFISCNTGELSGGNNIEKMWFFFRNLGYSAVSTAGALGNMGVESAGSFDPRIVQGDLPISNFSYDYTTKVDNGKISKDQFVNHGPNGGGYGLVQWTYPSRKKGLYEYAKKSSVSIGDLKMQLEYVIIEINGDWKNSRTYKQWKNASNTDEATIAYMKGYENPGQPHEDQRKKYARDIYNKYKDKKAPSSSTVQTNSKNLSKKEKIKLIYPNGVPKNKKDVEKYLTKVEVPITSKSGKKGTTSVTVHKAIAGDVKAALIAAQNAGFVVYEIGGYREYGSDSAGKNSDVGLVYSQHCYGLAVDINVNENCFYKGGRCTVGKSHSGKYAITPSTELYKSFIGNGWGWGGNWNSSKDYMHFSYFGT